MLAHIASIVAAEQPDVFLLSGDVFNVGQPSAQTVSMYNRGMLEIVRACPAMRVVVISGNHDSASRHEASRCLWELGGIVSVGALDRSDPGAHVFDLGVAVAVALPYVPERLLPDGYVASAVERGRTAAGSRPLLVLAHTTVTGGDLSGQGTGQGYNIGGIDSVGLDAFGSGWDYLALGHIHKRQTIAGSNGRARYCGTPVPISFAEDFDHGVDILEMDGDTFKVRQVGLPPERLLLTVPSKAAPWDAAMQALRELDPLTPAYVMLNVAVDDALPPDAYEQCRNALQHTTARFCDIRVQRSRQLQESGSDLSVNELSNHSPLEMARRFAADSGVDWDEDMDRMMAHVIGLLAQEDNA